MLSSLPFSAALLPLLVLAGAPVLQAQFDTGRMTPIDLRNLSEIRPVDFPAEYEDATILTAKRGLLIDLPSDPVIANSNFRYTLKRRSGLLLAEEEIQGTHFNIGFRGLTPHAAFLTDVYQDGFPMSVSAVGSRFVGSIPNLHQVSQLRFLHGGSNVSYGSLPTGAVNLISYPAAGDQPFRPRNTTTVGDLSYFSNVFEASGTSGEWSYAAFLNYVTSDGTPEQPGFDNRSGGFRIERRFSDYDTFSLAYQAYLFDSDNLSSVITSTAGVNNVLNYYYQNVDRHMLNALWARDFNNGGRLETRAWFHLTDGERDFRETLVPILGFTVEETDFYGIDARYIKPFNSGYMQESVFNLGLSYLGSSGTITSVPSRDGEVRLDLDTADYAMALFAEIRFQLSDRLAVVPGLRFETMQLEGEGIRGNGTTDNNAVVDRSFDDTAFQYSLGLEYDLAEVADVTQRPAYLFANISNGFRAPTFNEVAYLGAGNSLDPDLELATLMQIEGGIRGTHASGLIYELTAFWFEFDDQYQRVGGVQQNIGKTEHSGAELFAEIDLFKLADYQSGRSQDASPRVGPRSPANTSGMARFGRFSIYAAISILDTEIKESAIDSAVGLEVPYAPDSQVNFGLTYNYFDRIKANLNVRYVGEHLGNVNNDRSLVGDNSAALIESYTVVDLSLEYATWADRLVAFINVNNLFDEEYFGQLQGGTTPASRLWAPGTNVYAGIRLQY